MKNVLILNLMPNKIETENHFKNIFSKDKNSNGTCIWTDNYFGYLGSK